MNLTSTKIKRTCLLVAVLALAVGIESLGVAWYLRFKELAAAERFAIKADPNALWSADRAVMGNPKAPYRLVEFGDFQCPPCRAAATKIENWQTSSRDSVRYQFRNYPLKDIHPKAEEYALLAESVTLSDYWLVNDDLFQLQGSNDPKIIASLKDLAKKADREVVARQHLREDLALTEKLNLSKTPTLLLLTPEGRVFDCPSVEYARKLIDMGI